MTETNTIHLKSLRFAWPNQAPLLAIENLQVAKGEKLFLRGPSGSGKSTLLGVLGGVLQPQAGEVQLLGQRLTPLSQAARDAFRADHIGFVFQLFNLLPYLSVIDNVLLPCRFSPSRKQRVREKGGNLTREAARLLTHLQLTESLWQRPVTELSVGQQQRVAVARALIGHPELLIADEPTSALDSDTRDAFLALLLEECHTAGTTVVFVSHDAALEEQFERCVLLTDINDTALPSPQPSPRERGSERL